MTAKAKTRALTPKQEIFSAELIKNGGNATAAALKAYPNATYRSAKTIGWENMTKLDLAKATREEFNRQGVTLEKALRPIVKGLEAKTKDGADDLDKQMRAHDRWLKASTIDKEDNGLQLNIENAQGIEITFKNMGGSNGTSGSTTQDA
jgi:phage terminase small subunit